jgi:hypothetical protein
VQLTVMPPITNAVDGKGSSLMTIAMVHLHKVVSKRKKKSDHV